MNSLLARRTSLLGVCAAVFIFAGSAMAQETGLGRDCTKPNENQPQVAFDADNLSVLAGTRVKLTATGRGAQGEPVEYMWHADQGKIFGRGASVEYDTSGLPPGQYAVSLIGRGNKCVTNTVVKSVEVIACPPGLGLSANNVNVKAGEIVTVNAYGVPTGMTLRWTSSAGTVVETGTGVTIDTGGLSADTITVSASAVGIPDCARDITIAVARPPVVLPDILNFPMTSGRLNNANKAVLDDVTLRGAQDVQAKIIITGKSTQGERRGLARQRAENARNYLVSEKGIDPARIELRTQEGTATQGGIEIAVVPPGAQYP
jgi:hypothetical protein